MSEQDSASARWAEAGKAMAEGMRAGVERASLRRAELAATGMTQEEILTAMLREQASDPEFAKMLAYSEGVVRRSFWALYEDEDA